MIEGRISCSVSCNSSYLLLWTRQSNKWKNLLPFQRYLHNSRWTRGGYEQKKQHMKFAIPQKCGVPLQPSMCIPLGASCAHQFRALLCGAATTNLFTILVQEHCKNYGFAEHETTANGTTFIRCDDYKWLLIKIRNQMQMSKAISAKTLRHRYHSVARK